MRIPTLEFRPPVVPVFGAVLEVRLAISQSFKEVQNCLLAYNLVRWAMAAVLSDVLPLALSFAGAKRPLNAFSDQLHRTQCDQVRTMFAIVFASIATLQLPHRPDRIEPRAKKRQPF